MCVIRAQSMMSPDASFWTPVMPTATDVIVLPGPGNWVIHRTFGLRPNTKWETTNSSLNFNIKQKWTRQIIQPLERCTKTLEQSLRMGSDREPLPQSRPVCQSMCSVSNRIYGHGVSTDKGRSAGQVSNTSVSHKSSPCSIPDTSHWDGNVVTRSERVAVPRVGLLRHIAPYNCNMHNNAPICAKKKRRLEVVKLTSLVSKLL